MKKFKSFFLCCAMGTASALLLSSCGSSETVDTIAETATSTAETSPSVEPSASAEASATPDVVEFEEIPEEVIDATESQLDSIGERLIPPNAVQDTVSQSNLKLSIEDSVDNIREFYSLAFVDIGAIPQDTTEESNAAAPPDEEPAVLNLTGTYDDGKEIAVRVIDSDEPNVYTVWVTY